MKFNLLSLSKNSTSDKPSWQASDPEGLRSFRRYAYRAGFRFPISDFRLPISTLRLLTLAFALAISLTASAQEPCTPMFPRGGLQDWGSGAYYLPEAFNAKVYTSTNGDYYGTMVREPRSLRVVAKRNEWRRVDYSDLEWIGNHNLKYLKVKPADNPDYVRVIWNTYEGERYMKKSELEKAGAIYQSYRDYLFNEDLNLPETAKEGRKATLGININRGCLDLKIAPDTTAQSLQCIEGNRFGDSVFTEIKILESKEHWAKVQLIKWRHDAELEATGAKCTYRPEQLGEGWIKAVEEDGFPYIWFATTY